MRKTKNPETEMRHIKNFIHNINDIVLAIVIVAIAAGIIFWRMQIILDYPKTIVQNQTVTEEAAEESSEEASGEAPAEAAPAEEAAPQEAPAEEAPVAEAPAENAE